MSEEMPKEQAIAFEKCMICFIDALADTKKTGQTIGLLVASDQIKAYEDEYNATVEIDEVNRRLSQRPKKRND